MWDADGRIITLSKSMWAGAWACKGHLLCTAFSFKARATCLLVLKEENSDIRKHWALWCRCCSALNLQQMDHQMQVLRFVTVSLAAFGSKRRTLVEHRILPQKDWTEQSQSLFTLTAPDFAEWRPADHVHLIVVFLLSNGILMFSEFFGL